MPRPGGLAREGTALFQTGVILAVVQRPLGLAATSHTKSESYNPNIKPISRRGIALQCPYKPGGTDETWYQGSPNL
jgi:hypothetical protein